jgi:hypothetical protein
MPFSPRQPEIKAQCVKFPCTGGNFISINCLIASKAISSLLKFLCQKSEDKGVIVSGKYNPLSGANPCISAFLKGNFGALWFKL